jgi:hypothetical protein
MRCLVETELGLGQIKGPMEDSLAVNAGTEHAVGHALVPTARAAYRTSVRRLVSRNVPASIRAR